MQYQGEVENLRFALLSEFVLWLSLEGVVGFDWGMVRDARTVSFRLAVISICR